MDTFLNTAMLLARIATVAKNGQPHVVPVWYLWEQGSLWISSFRSTRHVHHLQLDPRCAVTIDEAPSGTENRGVILTGQVELIVAPRDFVASQSEKVYERYLGPVGVKAPDPQSWIYDDENLIIKLTPQRTRVWGI
jgi:nitroimidazol reductase NimA-like FMN-containing flavoprotein (pyridoxamine 5'-phosphate oxidase superfamily)